MRESFIYFTNVWSGMEYPSCPARIAIAPALDMTLALTVALALGIALEKEHPITTPGIYWWFLPACLDYIPPPDQITIPMNLYQMETYL